MAGIPKTLAACFAILAQGCAAAGSDAAGLRAATYNIRLDTDADGADAWPFRRNAVSAVIGYYEPDVIGLQEVRAHQLEHLKEDLGAYEFFGVGRDDGREAGEFSPIAYRKARLERVESGTFWLSPTPEIPSKGWDAAFPRLVTWMRLRLAESGASLLVLNTHWDHVGVNARAQSALMIDEWVGKNRGSCEAVILLGDFNAAKGDAAYESLAAPREGGLKDTIDISETPPFGPRGTFNGFDVSSADDRAIDHVLVSDGVRTLKHGVITQHDAGRLPSDHYPVVVDLAVPACPDR